MTKKELEKRVAELEKEVGFLRGLQSLKPQYPLTPFQPDRDMFRVPLEKQYPGTGYEPWGSPIIWC